MAGYDDTYQMIISTLMGRPVGTEIQPDSQQAYEINMLNYIRSLELIANGPLIGIAEPDTQPIQPNDARACYIAGVAQDRTVAFQNFRNYLGQPIQITNGQMEACLVILIWDTQYWSATQVPTNIISAAEQANFYYSYNVKKTYSSIASMNADSNNPIGTDGKYIKIGDIVTVVNSTTPSENGIYSYEGATNGWKYQSSFNFQLEQIRSQNTNTAPSNKLFDDTISSMTEFVMPNLYHFDKLKLSEFYMKGVKSEDTITCKSLSSNSNNFSMTIYVNDVAVINFSINNPVIGTVYKATANYVPGYEDSYIVISQITDYSNSGAIIAQFYSKNVCNVANSPKVQKYISNLTEQRIDENSGNISSIESIIENILSKPKFIQRPDVDSNILELFVKIDGVDNTNINFGTISINWDTKAATLYGYVGSTYSIGIVIPTGTLQENFVYEFTTPLKDKKVYGYIVFKNSSNISLSGLTGNTLTTNTNIIGNLIESYLENERQLNLIELNSYFINNENANNAISELYIPNIESYGALTVYSQTSYKTSIRLFLRNSNGDVVLQAAEANTPYGYDYYKIGAITPIIEVSTLKTVGWVIFNHSVDYASSGTSFAIFPNAIKNIDNSPTIKSMLDSDEQIVLLGDSIIGQPAQNVLPFALSGLTKKRVFQLGFGGCTMAWRSAQGGGTDYDWFSFVSIADAIASGDYSLQENATGTVDYRFQIDQMKSIDWTKKITIICNYVNNDLTNGIELGNSYNSNMIIDELNKNKFLEAQIYGVKKILTAHPDTKFIFLGKMFRMYNNGVLPEFEYVNPTTNLNAQNFIDSEKDNCKKMGLRFIDAINYGVRTSFNINSYTLDGTHFNGYGATEFAKYLYNLWKEINI